MSVLRLSTKPGVKVTNLNERWNLNEQDKHERARKCAAFDTVGHPQWEIREMT